MKRFANVLLGTLLFPTVLCVLLDFHLSSTVKIPWILKTKLNTPVQPKTPKAQRHTHTVMADWARTPNILLDFTWQSTKPSSAVHL